MIPVSSVFAGYAVYYYYNRTWKIGFIKNLTSSAYINGFVAGGSGWGFTKDSNDKWSLEVDKLYIRDEL